MIIDDPRIWLRSRRRRQKRRTKMASSSLVMTLLTTTAVFFAGMVMLTTCRCCQADDNHGGVDGGRDINAESGRRRRRRRTRGEEKSLRGVGGVVADIMNNDTIISPMSGVRININNDTNPNNKSPKTFLIQFRDGLAQTRSLEIHHNSRRRRQQQLHPATREARGEHGADGKKWQSRAKSISSISDDRHIAIVEMFDPDNNPYGEEVAGASTASEMYDELLADEDVELVEEDFLMYKYSFNTIDAYFTDNDEEETSVHSKNTIRNHPKPTTTATDTSTTMQNERQHQQYRQLAEAKQYGIDLIQASSVWSHVLQSDPSSYPNTPVKVCIIDTGYDVTHEDLPKKNITGTQTSYGDYLVDGDGHGTHVAGVIGAVGNNDVGVMGVNPDPRKFSFHISKALNRDGFGTASSVLKGIRGCIDSGSRILSMSLGGGPESKIFRNIYEEAYDKGILSFAAAGNLGLMQDDFPASYPTVVSVGAVDSDGKRASFSNWNAQLELMAPGVDILSTYPGNIYGSLSGTSMATPFAAGVAALIWGYFPQCSNQQIRNVLAATAKAIAADGSRCDRKTGFGLVQARDAFDLLDTFGCDAGGNELFDPPSNGGVGGCNQPVANLTKLSISETSFVIPSTGDNCQKLMLTLLTDGYAYETSWDLKRLNDGVEVQTGPSGGDKFEDNTMYRGPVGDCLDPGTYEFTIRDKFGDGLKQPGYYAIKLNGNYLVTNSSKFGNSETTSFVINATTPQLDARQPDPVWTSILYEDFDSGIGKFIDGGSDAAYVDSRFGRNGLVMVKSGRVNYNQASISSRNIQLDNSGGITQFMIDFSFYASNIGVNDGFCLDTKANGASDWALVKCWKVGVDFDNRKWYDDESLVFRTGTESSTSISIRFRGFSSDVSNRIFYDKIELFGSS